MIILYIIGLIIYILLGLMLAKAFWDLLEWNYGICPPKIIKIITGFLLPLLLMAFIVLLVWTIVEEM